MKFFLTFIQKKVSTQFICRLSFEHNESSKHLSKTKINKLQDNIEIKNSGQVMQREHKNTHYASYTCSVLKARQNRNLLTFCSFDNTMAAVG